MTGQDLGELGLVLWPQQGFDGAGRQLAERGVGWREHGEGAVPGQCLDQARGLHGCHERGVVLRVDGVLDDVLRRIHRRAADCYGLFGREARDDRIHCEAERENRGSGQSERRYTFHGSLRCSVCCPRKAETSRATEGLKLRMQEQGHRFVSLPVPITGPVGRPVVDPPGGSSETANTASLLARPASSPDSVSVIGASARSRPTGLGLPSGGISQSSGTRVASALKAAGTIATVPRFTSMVATKWRWPPPSIVATSGSGCVKAPK